jgi:hypothetical protein
MGAPIGNQFWKLRSKIGRDKLWETPELLWDACVEYFESTDSRKWYKTEFNGKDAKECRVPTETPYTWTGLYLFLDCSHTTWQDYEKREAYIAITARVRNIIYTQKFEGAAVGAFNAQLISRDLELVDRQDVKQEISKGILNIDPLDDQADPSAKEDIQS